MWWPHSYAPVTLITEKLGKEAGNGAIYVVCVIILGSNLSGRNNPKNGQNNFFSRVRIGLAICCQYAKF